MGFSGVFHRPKSLRVFGTGEKEIDGVRDSATFGTSSWAHRHISKNGGRRGGHRHVPTIPLIMGSLEWTSTQYE